MPTTNVPSYPSEDAVEAGVNAALLTLLFPTSVVSYLFPSGATYFNAQAQEAAMSRLYGGIHYRSDIAVGLAQGQRIGDYTVRFAKSDGAN